MPTDSRPSEPQLICLTAIIHCVKPRLWSTLSPSLNKSAYTHLFYTFNIYIHSQVAEAGGGWGKLLEDRPPNAMILEAQKYVQERLEKKWLPLFLVTPEFAIRQKPKTNMDDVVDDVIVQKKKKTLNMLKVCKIERFSTSSDQKVRFVICVFVSHIKNINI